MKRVNLIVAFAISMVFFMSSCRSSTIKEEQSEKKIGGSFELNNSSPNDTINLIDADGNKQGHWVNKKFAVVSHTIISNYAPDSIIDKKVTKETEQFNVEEGYYKDNKKEGVWKIFYSNGKVKDSMVYNSGLITP